MPAWIHTLTVDASFDARCGTVGIGIVVQERIGSKRRRGPIIDQIAESHPAVPGGDAEAFAVFRALDIARDRGYARVRVRSDYNFMRRTLRDRHRRQEGLDAPGVYGRILRLARTFEFVDFGLVYRRKNHIAHRLARQASRISRRSKEPPCDAAGWPIEFVEGYGDLEF